MATIFPLVLRSSGAHIHTQTCTHAVKIRAPLTTAHSLHGVNEMDTKNTQQTVTSTLSGKVLPITSAFVISPSELPSAGLGFERNLSLAALFLLLYFFCLLSSSGKNKTDSYLGGIGKYGALYILHCEV